MEWIKGLDLSFSPTTLAWWQARYAEGYRVMSQCLWTGLSTPSSAYNNLLNAKRAGFIITGYTNTKFAHGATAVNKAKAAAADLWDDLYQVQVDVEIAGVREEDIKWPLEELLRLGKRPVIYTAYWFWVGTLGNPKWSWLTDWGLWNAYYDGDPDIDFASASYGPWTANHLWGEQYQGTTYIDGVGVDLNVFRKDLYTKPSPAPPAPAPEPEPTPDPVSDGGGTVEEEEDMAREPRHFISPKGHPEVYELERTSDGGFRLVHVVGRSVFLQRYISDLDTFEKDVTPEDSSWRCFSLHTEYPLGVPGKLLEQ